MHRSHGHVGFSYIREKVGEILFFSMWIPLSSSQKDKLDRSALMVQYLEKKISGLEPDSPELQFKS